MNEEQAIWEFSVGTYNGVLFGYRMYETEETIEHVVYIPFIDFCFTKFKK
jgi:hypothetical protein